jgi:hypothetical protein
LRAETCNRIFSLQKIAAVFYYSKLCAENYFNLFTKSQKIHQKLHKTQNRVCFKSETNWSLNTNVPKNAAFESFWGFLWVFLMVFVTFWKYFYALKILLQFQRAIFCGLKML